MEFRYMKLYSWLYLRYWLKEFSHDDIRDKALELEIKTPINILIQRLVRKGYIERMARGKYRVVHPNIILLETLGFRWRDRVNIDYRLMIEVFVSRLIEYFRDKLISIILFGSVARGMEKEYSDIDFLIVARYIPSRYSDRIKIIVDILSDLKELRRRLWIEKKIYPLIDVILLDDKEANMYHPFYLDLVHDGIIIYDRDSFMKRRIEKLRKRLMELGSRRVELPDGKYYWILKPSVKWGDIIEL